MNNEDVKIKYSNHFIGQQIAEEHLQNKLEDKFEDGSIELIYGMIRNGKSTYAVRRMYEVLMSGGVVYSNIMLDLSHEIFDERDGFNQTLFGLLFNKNIYYVFDKKNYHFFDPITGECDGIQVFDPEDPESQIEWLNSITDAWIFYDEGQWLLDSYEKTYVSVSKRKLITESGHVGRHIVLIAQRTQSIHVNGRGNCNIFWKCKKEKFLFWTRLWIFEFQEMKGQDVDEDREPVSTQMYWFNNKYWRLFNTHYLRRGRPRSQKLYYTAYKLTYNERLKLLRNNIYQTILKYLPKKPLA